MAEPPAVSAAGSGLAKKDGNLDGTRTRIVRMKGGCPNQLDDKVGIRRLAERGGHAPHAATWRHDLFSKESRLAGPVHVPIGKCCGRRGR